MGFQEQSDFVLGGSLAKTLEAVPEAMRRDPGSCGAQRIQASGFHACSCILVPLPLSQGPLEGLFLPDPHQTLGR